MTTLTVPCVAALLDVDGVLVSTDDAVEALWAEVCARSGRAAPGPESLVHIVGCSPEHTAHHLFPGSDGAQLHAVLDVVRELEADLDVSPVPGAADLIRALHGAGVPVALVTGASQHRLGRVMQALRLDDEVGATVTWGETPGKPEPDPYLLAAQRLGVAVTDCIVVEDAPSGVRSAVAAGATCFGLAPLGSARARDLAHADAAAVLSCLHQIRVVPNAPSADRPGTSVQVTAGAPHPPCTPRGSS